LHSLNAANSQLSQRARWSSQHLLHINAAPGRLQLL
jgi:hypothetical protein